MALFIGLNNKQAPTISTTAADILLHTAYLASSLSFVTAITAIGLKVVAKRKLEAAPANAGFLLTFSKVF